MRDTGIEYLPAAVRTRLAGRVFEDSYDQEQERRALLTRNRQQAWAASVDNRFRSAGLDGMYRRDRQPVEEWLRRLAAHLQPSEPGASNVGAIGDLLLWSQTPGGGKTHTAYAILNLVNRELGARVAAVIADELMDTLGTASSDHGTTERLWREADVLLIDEIGKASRPGHVVARLWQIHDARYRAGRPTVFTTNADLGSLEQAYPTLVSRMRHNGTRVQITHPDRRVSAIASPGGEPR